jgi:hypothetical protein
MWESENQDESPLMTTDNFHGIDRLEVQARESSDNPMLNAFCRVAPSVRFKALAIFPAGVFFRAADFSSRTSADVHERRFEFLAI